MLTKGIVEKLIDSYKIKVRIPVYNKPNYVNGATSTDNLYEACICTLPNCYINVQVGDVVILGFEDNNTAQPIILGCLYAKDITDSKVDLIVNSLQALNSVTLPKDTSIGNVTARDLEYLSGTKGNIQGQLDAINSYQINKTNKWVSYVDYSLTEDLDTNEINIPIENFDKISQYKIFIDIYSSNTASESLTVSFIDDEGDTRDLFTFDNLSSIDSGKTTVGKVSYDNSLSITTPLPPGGDTAVTFFVNKGERLIIPYGDGSSGWNWVKKNINTLHELVYNNEFTFSPEDSKVEALSDSLELYTLTYKRSNGNTIELLAYSTNSTEEEAESFIGVCSKDLDNPGHLEFRDVESEKSILYYRLYSEGFCTNIDYVQTACNSFSTNDKGGYILEDGIKLSNSLIGIKAIKIKLSNDSVIRKDTKIAVKVLYK